MEEPTWSWGEAWGDELFGAGMAEVELAARRLAKLIVADICTYGVDELKAVGPAARLELAANIEEGRGLFQERMPRRVHGVYEEALVQIDVWAEGRVVHEQWLMDGESARSVGRRWEPRHRSRSWRPRASGGPKDLQNLFGDR